MNNLYIYSLSLICLSSTAIAQTCAMPPTCESLGYAQKATDCGSDAKSLKCPFDLSKVFCVGNLSSPDTACSLGSILYSDKSCFRGVDTGKTAIGVVFDANRRLAVALSDASVKMYWSPDGKRGNIVSLSDCDSYDTALYCNPNGKNNTSKIIAQYGNNTNYAAGYCANYVTAGTSKGDWFLPSMSELADIHDARFHINSAVQLLGKAPFASEGSYWSSSEKDYNGYIWTLYLGIVGGNPNKYYSFATGGNHYVFEKNNVRPIIAF